MELALEHLAGIDADELQNVKGSLRDICVINDVVKARQSAVTLHNFAFMAKCHLRSAWRTTRRHFACKQRLKYSKEHTIKVSKTLSHSAKEQSANDLQVP